MDGFVATAALVGWEDVRGLSGWVGLISFVLMLALTQYMGRTFATKSELKREKEDRREACALEKLHRETADGHIDERVHHLSEIVQQYIGKIDLLRDRLDTQDRAREREVADLREEVRVGFGRLEEGLRQLRRDNKRMEQQ